MRKINYIIALFALLLSNSLSAQLEKGSFLMGDDVSNINLFNQLFGPDNRSIVGFQFTNFNDDLSPNFSIFQALPEFGYFATKGLMVGGNLSFLSFGSDGERSSLMSVAPKVRYYFNPNSPKFNVFAQAQPALAFSLGDDGGSSFGWGISGGVSTFLTPNVILDTELAYRDFDVDGEDDTSIGLDLNLKTFLSPTHRKGAKSAVSGIGKGTWMIGASTASFNVFLGEENATQLNFQPRVSYFVIPKLAVGLGLGIDLLSQDTDTEEFNSRSLNIAPSLRYYFNSSKHLMFFGGAKYRFQDSKTTILDFEFNSTASAFDVELGLNLFISPSAAFEFSISPSFIRSEDDVLLESNNSTQFNTQIGFNYFLGTNKE
jgi:Outer membrane protein beta-barrel domain